MYKLVVTKLAEDDLEEIVEYISVDLANPSAATEFLNDVVKCYDYLKSNPYIYAISDDRRLAKEGYRKALVKNFYNWYMIKAFDLFRALFSCPAR